MEKRRAGENEHFHFLTHEEFAVLSREAKVSYLADATREVSRKIDEVLSETERSRFN
jgi:hypothetical protein